MRRRIVAPLLIAAAALTMLCQSALAAGTGSGVTVKKSYDRTMTEKDLANQVAVNEIMQHKGAKLVKAELYAPCPGFGGLQIYRVPQGKSSQTVEIAFSALDGHVVTATYARAADSPPSRKAEQTMKGAVCDTGLSF